MSGCSAKNEGCVSTKIKRVIAGTAAAFLLLFTIFISLAGMIRTHTGTLWESLDALGKILYLSLLGLLLALSGKLAYYSNRTDPIVIKHLKLPQSSHPDKS